MASSTPNMPKNQRVWLIPNFLSASNEADFIADTVRKNIHHLTHFVVENEKEARALIKKLHLATPQAQLQFCVWNQHSKPTDFVDITNFLKAGVDIGVISDAGLPCIADPGAEVVAYAHKQNIEVVPLPGASSIFMALMASGLNGQGFTFNGYLPIDKPHKLAKIKQLEQEAITKNHSQIFMETPYRNNQLLADVLVTCKAQTKLCIACNISGTDGFVVTKTIENWKKHTPDLHKKPTIFIFG